MSDNDNNASGNRMDKPLSMLFAASTAIATELDNGRAEAVKACEAENEDGEDLSAVRNAQIWLETSFVVTINGVERTVEVSVTLDPIPEGEEDNYQDFTVFDTKQGATRH